MRVLFSIVLAAVVSACTTANSKPPVSSPLHDEISRLDSQMFEAFNAHDVGKLMSWFSRDLEFYHDKDGLLTYDQVTQGFTKMFAQNNGIRRELLPETLEVYPIPGHGAMEIGSHRFCHVENGRNDCGVFRFANVWRKENGSWRITRVLSYDHR